MTYSVSAGLQEAVYNILVADTQLGAIVGTAIFETLPPGETLGLYVLLGEETVRDRSHKTGYGAEHLFTVSIVGSDVGFHRTKQAAAAVSDALVDNAPTLTSGRVVSLRFLSGRARRVRSALVRRIDLTFRAIVEDD